VEENTTLSPSITKEKIKFIHIFESLSFFTSVRKIFGSSHISGE
jgi:hypothetical protein